MQTNINLFSHIFHRSRLITIFIYKKLLAFNKHNTFQILILQIYIKKLMLEES